MVSMKRDHKVKRLQPPRLWGLESELGMDLVPEAFEEEESKVTKSG